jgi:hypothetical protein
MLLKFHSRVMLVSYSLAECKISSKMRNLLKMGHPPQARISLLIARRHSSCCHCSSRIFASTSTNNRLIVDANVISEPASHSDETEAFSRASNSSRCNAPS